MARFNRKTTCQCCGKEKTQVGDFCPECALVMTKSGYQKTPQKIDFAVVHDGNKPIVTSDYTGTNYTVPNVVLGAPDSVDHTEVKAMDKPLLIKLMLRIAIRHLDKNQILPDKSLVADEAWEEMSEEQRQYQWFVDLKQMAAKDK
jgi:hypothetical protein